jgi:hypothetical protein
MTEDGPGTARTPRWVKVFGIVAIVVVVVVVIMLIVGGGHGPSRHSSFGDTGSRTSL